MNCVILMKKTGDAHERQINKRTEKRTGKRT